MRPALAAALALFLLAPLAPAQQDPRLAHAYRFPQSGWTYVHLEGSPAQIGFQHGSLLAPEIEDLYKTFSLEDTHESGKPWSTFRSIAKDQLWPHIDPEYRAELSGIAEGVQSKGSHLDVWDIVALNAHLEVPDYYLPWLATQQHKPANPALVAPSRCSAFIATGSATADGKIVMAHSNWSSYIEGERWTVVFDIAPTHGHRFLMDGAPGLIHSADDFGVNDAGIMITETTLPQFKGWDPKGIPEFVRARKAMQYSSSIDDFVRIMRTGNNGGYANSWMVGDRNTDEIAYLELGLKHTPVTRKKDGYFVSANFPVDPALTRDDTPGFDPKNMKSSMNARHVTAEAFIQQHLGHIDTTVAEQYLSNHYDSFDRRDNPGTRSLCGHMDTSKDAETAWDLAPFAPLGAVTGKVMDSAQAEHMSFTAHAGHPCGEDFIAAPFLIAHPEYAWQRPVMHDMKSGPWTPFTTNQTPASALASTHQQ